MDYSIKQTAELLNISKSTVYRQLNKAMQNGAKNLQKKCENSATLVTQKGFDYLSKLNNISDDNCKQEQDDISSENIIKQQQQMIDLLQEQIKIKDTEISNLMTQAQNYQVLLLQEKQNKLLVDDTLNDCEGVSSLNTDTDKQKKGKLFSWIFGKK
jgi:DNA-directed RNA polymerase specialized sigma subunit